MESSTFAHFCTDVRVGRDLDARQDVVLLDGAQPVDGGGDEVGRWREMRGGRAGGERGDVLMCHFLSPSWVLARTE